MSNEITSTKRFWGFSPAECVVLLVLLACLLGAIVVRIAQRTGAAGKGAQVCTVKEEFQHKLDLNAASQQELLLVPGIGTARARRIDEYRKKQGRFEVVSDLRRVDGFTPKLVDQLAPFFYVAPPSQNGKE